MTGTRSDNWTCVSSLIGSSLVSSLGVIMTDFILFFDKESFVQSKTTLCFYYFWLFSS